MNSQIARSLQLVLDTAAMVLIWMVQLVIYPAFLRFKKDDFQRWHPVYTRKVTYVVLPVMLGQLVTYGWLVTTAACWHVWLNLLLVLAVWAITFFRAVPLHASLDTNDDHLPVSSALVAINWWRTVLWTVVWVITMVSLFRGMVLLKP